MSDAPVTRRHREEAARAAQWSKITCAKNNGWFEQGIKTTVGCFELDRHAQSLANAEAAIHARYAGLVERVREARVELRATGGDQNVLGWLERGLKELEDAK